MKKMKKGNGSYAQLNRPKQYDDTNAMWMDFEWIEWRSTGRKMSIIFLLSVSPNIPFVVPCSSFLSSDFRAVVV